MTPEIRDEREACPYTRRLAQLRLGYLNVARRPRAGERASAQRVVTVVEALRKLTLGYPPGHA